MSRLLMEKLAEDKNKDVGSGEQNDELRAQKKKLGRQIGKNVAISAGAAVGGPLLNRAIYKKTMDQDTEHFQSMDKTISGIQDMLGKHGIKSERAELKDMENGPKHGKGIGIGITVDEPWIKPGSGRFKSTGNWKIDEMVENISNSTGYRPKNKIIGTNPHINMTYGGAASTPVGLHEAGHAINDIKLKGITTKMSTAGEIGNAVLPAAAATAGALRARQEEREKKTGRVSNFIDKHPYIASSLMNIPTLTEEALASGRAINHMRKDPSLKKRIPEAIGTLGGAYSTYLLDAAKHTLMGGSAYKASKAIAQKRYLDKKKQNNNDLQNSNS